MVLLGLDEWMERDEVERRGFAVHFEKWMWRWAGIFFFFFWGHEKRAYGDMKRTKVAEGRRHFLDIYFQFSFMHFQCRELRGSVG